MTQKYDFPVYILYKYVANFIYREFKMYMKNMIIQYTFDIFM